MSETGFVVIGSSGEYSDREEWPIVVVATEDRAKQVVMDLDTKARELCLTGRLFTSPNYRLLERDAIPALEAFYPGATGSNEYLGSVGFRFFYSSVRIETE